VVRLSGASLRIGATVPLFPEEGGCLSLACLLRGINRHYCLLAKNDESKVELKKECAMSIAKNSVAVLLVLTLAVVNVVWAAPTLGAENETIVLVATPELHDPLYGETILIAKPLQGGQHLGFILNRPTKVSLADLFPEHKPSRSVQDPIYLGGPSELSVVFAMVADHDSPGDGSLQLAPDLYLAVAAQTVDRIIETASDHARFFAGAVVWRPGELDEELKRGAWYVLDVEPELVLRKTTAGLWQELVKRAEIRKKAI
jgi:putative transcriptional regulator